MLYVNTHIANSAIHGIGLFASENIEKGTVVCQWLWAFDKDISWPMSSKFPEVAKKYLNQFGFETDKVGGFLLFGDNFRFVNHRVNCNLFTYIDPKEPFPMKLAFVALSDIKEHTELVIDYSSISMPQYLKVSQPFTEMRDGRPWPPRMDVDKLKKVD